MGEYELLQSRYVKEPWRMMVVCILLNQTTRRQVEPVLSQLFTVAPTPQDMVRLPDAKLVEILRPLGLQNRRAVTLRAFSRDWMYHMRNHPPGTDPMMWLPKCHGIGEYAVDSYRIFVKQNYQQPTSLDKELLAYLDSIGHGPGAAQDDNGSDTGDTEGST